MNSFVRCFLGIVTAIVCEDTNKNDFIENQEIINLMRK